MCEIAIASSHGGGVCPWEGVGLATVPYLTRGSCGSLTLSQIKTVCLSADIESGGVWARVPIKTRNARSRLKCCCLDIEPRRVCVGEVV